jgi:hypothetical protein
MQIYEYEQKLKDAFRASRLTSGGMRLVRVSVKAEQTTGRVEVNCSLDPGGLPEEAVEELVTNSLNSVGIAAFLREGQWSNVDIDCSAGNVVTIKAIGFYSLGGNSGNSTGQTPQSAE